MIYKDICLFGDSITRGAGVPEEKYSWAAMVSKKHRDINFHNHGVGGSTSAAALKRIDDVLKDSPQITTVQFGMNDHCMDESGESSVGLKEFKENMQYIVESLVRINSKVILMTNHLIIEGDENSYYYSRHHKKSYEQEGGANRVLKKYNEIIREVSHSNDILCIDMHVLCQNYNPYEFLRSLENSEMDDGVHPHILDSRIYADEVDKAISKIMKNGEIV